MINSVFESLIQVSLQQYIVVTSCEGKWWSENLFHKVHKLWHSPLFCPYHVYHHIVLTLRKPQQIRRKKYVCVDRLIHLRIPLDFRRC